MDNYANLQKFEITFADNEKMLEAVKHLRGSIFFGSAEKEEDEFDSYCRHLVVIDKEKNDIIGSYRLLLGSDAKKHSGFYSEKEFDLSNIKKNCQGEVLEMSRACVLSEYRRYPILKFMWKTILDFIAEKKVNYIFGCPSMEKPSPKSVDEALYFFKKNCFTQEKFRVSPRKENIFKLTDIVSGIDEKEVYRNLPSLIKGYLKMGALVCSEPAWDSVFETADFFMLLDVASINKNYKKRFQ